MSAPVPPPARIPHGDWDRAHSGIVPTPPAAHGAIGERAGRGGGPGHPRCDSGYECTGWPNGAVYHDTGDADDYRHFCGSCAWRSRTNPFPSTAWQASAAEPRVAPNPYRASPDEKREREPGRYRPPPYQNRKRRRPREEKEGETEWWQEEEESWSLEEEAWLVAGSQGRKAGVPGVSISTSSGVREASQARSSSSAGVAPAGVRLAIQDRAGAVTEPSEDEKQRDEKTRSRKRRTRPAGMMGDIQRSISRSRPKRAGETRRSKQEQEQEPEQAQAWRRWCGTSEG